MVSEARWRGGGEGGRGTKFKLIIKSTNKITINKS